MDPLSGDPAGRRPPVPHFSIATEKETARLKAVPSSFYILSDLAIGPLFSYLFIVGHIVALLAAPSADRNPPPNVPTDAFISFISSLIAGTNESWTCALPAANP